MSKNRSKALKKGIGAKIKHFLSEHDLSQAELAKKLKKDEPHISRILNGKQNLTLETIAEIEAVLGIELLSLG